MENPDMPPKDTEDMEQISIRLPRILLEDVREMAAAEGWTPAQMYRICFEKGSAVHAEGFNKRLVNRNLRRKKTATSTED